MKNTRQTTPIYRRMTRHLMLPILVSMLVSSPTGVQEASANEALPLTGDMNQDGDVNILDVTCATHTALWVIQKEPGPPPSCTNDILWQTDLNCDSNADITDVLLSVQMALGAPLNPVLDANGDGIVDACSIDALCAGNACDTIRAFDLDSDGTVTRQEWFEYTGLLELVDDNGDGIVTNAEYLNGSEGSADNGPTKESSGTSDESNDETGSTRNAPRGDANTPPPRTDSGERWDSEDPGSRQEPGNNPDNRTDPGNRADPGTGGGNTGGNSGGGMGGGGTGGGTGGSTGGSNGGGGAPIPEIDPDCSENYDKLNFPKVWDSHPSECVPSPGDPADACTLSFTEFCDANDDGAVDDDKMGVGVTFCGGASKCTYQGMGGGTPIPCPCDKNEEIVQPPAPDCDPFGPTSPPPPGPGEPPHGIPPGACDFYGHVIQDPGGCSDYEKTLLGGYNQTCLNVTNGAGAGPNGGMCDLITEWREYVDGLRYCLQERVTDQVTAGVCLMPGTTCSEVVQEIVDAHAVCNNEQNFCDVMQDPDAAYCFGLGIGNAWGPILVGTTPLGPAAPLGPFQTLQSILECGLNATIVQDNICAGYRAACIATAGPGSIVETLCRQSCPYSWEILLDVIIPWPLSLLF